MNIAKFDCFSGLIDQGNAFHRLIYFKFLLLVTRIVHHTSSQAVPFGSIQQLLLKNEKNGLIIFLYKWLLIHQQYTFTIYQRDFGKEKPKKGDF